MMRSMIVMIVIVLSTAYADNAPLELTVELNKTEIHVFDPAYFIFTIRNKTDRDVAVCAEVITQLRGRGLWSLYSPGERTLVVVFRAYIAENFFIIPAQKYLKFVVYAYNAGELTDYYKGYNEGSEEQWSLYAILRHKLTPGARKRYKEFASKHDATIWEGEIRSDDFPFKFVPPTTPDDQVVFEHWKKECLRPSDNVKPAIEVICDEELKRKLPNHPIWDYWFWYSNMVMPPFWVEKQSDEEPLRRRMERFLARVDELIDRRRSEPEFRGVIEELLWRKVAVLYALGREAEAEALKQSIMAKEPNRCFFLELQWLKKVVPGLKRAVQRELQAEKGQNNTTQPATSEPEHPTPKKESSTTENHEVTAEQTNLHPEHGIEAVEKRRPRSKRGVGAAERRPRVAQRSDNLWLWLTLFGLAAVAVFILLPRRH